MYTGAMAKRLQPDHEVKTKALTHDELLLLLQPLLTTSKDTLGTHSLTL